MNKDTELLARLHIRGVAFIYACFFIFSSVVLISMWPPPEFVPGINPKMLLARDMTYLLFVPVISFGLWTYRKWGWWLIVFFNLATSAYYAVDCFYLTTGLCRGYTTTVVYRIVPQLIVAATFFIPSVRKVLLHLPNGEDTP